MISRPARNVAGPLCSLEIINVSCLLHQQATTSHRYFRARAPRSGSQGRRRAAELPPFSYPFPRRTHGWIVREARRCLHSGPPPHAHDLAPSLKRGARRECSQASRRAPLTIGIRKGPKEGANHAYFFHLALRAAAIALGFGCTVWSAYQSWQHNPWDFTGPLAAVSAAALFIFCEHAAKGRQWVHFGTLGILGSWRRPSPALWSCSATPNPRRSARRARRVETYPGWRPTRPWSQQRRSSKRLRPRQQQSARRATP